MKTRNVIQLSKRQGLVLAMINVGPEREGQPANNPEVGEPNDLNRDERDDYDITEEPLIGGEDRIEDSDLADEEPLQDDIDRTKVVDKQVREDLEEDENGLDDDTVI